MSTSFIWLLGICMCTRFIWSNMSCELPLSVWFTWQLNNECIDSILFYLHLPFSTCTHALRWDWFVMVFVYVNTCNANGFLRIFFSSSIISLLLFAAVSSWSCPPSAKDKGQCTRKSWCNCCRLHSSNSRVSDCRSSRTGRKRKQRS